MKYPFVVIGCLCALLSHCGFSVEPKAPPINSEGIRGRLVIVGGGRVPNAAIEAIKAGKLEDKPLVVMGVASSAPASAARSAIQWMREAGIADAIPANVSRNAGEDREKLIKQLKGAGGVWLCGGQQSRITAAYLDTQVETELHALLARGGVIGGTSAGAAAMSRIMISGGRDNPEITRGFDFLPGAIIDQHFSQRDRSDRSRVAVSRHPHRFGLGIDEATAVIVTGRTMQVVGEGNATVLLAESKHRAAATMLSPSGENLDLVQLHRAAQNRAANIDPGLPSGLPGVAQPGALVIVGGGAMPADVVKRYIELAGGKNARIVVLPTAGTRSSALRANIPEFLVHAEVAKVSMLPHYLLHEVRSAEFQQLLAEATGVWFGGGRQWNFVDIYEQPGAVALFRNVLERGGVIGGSSAGATIQGDYLVRGHPLGNTVMMAEGYERGFAFLPGVAIDQHFTQRRRQADLASVVRQFPRFFGIGIDESTALVVRGTTCEVVGKHAVHFISANPDGRPEPQAVSGSGNSTSSYQSARAGQQVTLHPFTIKATANP